MKSNFFELKIFAQTIFNTKKQKEKCLCLTKCLADVVVVVMTTINAMAVADLIVAG